MRPFTLLVKPACADCNLRCEYCFYLGKGGLYPGAAAHRMTDAVLEQMIRTYLATPQPIYSFGWQGGEPTLLGVDFFRRVTELQRRHGRPGASVANGLQTNATLISAELARHLAEYKFLVGCSLDGPPKIHDEYRRTIGGQSSHELAMRGIGLLRQHGVEFNILVLVSRANIGRAKEVYRYLVEQEFFYHQYIPCVEFDGKGRRRKFAIDGDDWGDFLCELFDEWHPKHASAVSIRLFDSVLARLVDGGANVCQMQQDCCQYFVVEHNGDLYPCDFFVEPALRLGSVMDTTWAQALESPVYAAFGARKARWNAACAACEYLDLCAGDCLKHRGHAAPGPGTLSWLCKGQKKFFRHTLDRFRMLAGEVRARRTQADSVLRHEALWTPAAGGGVGRNDPCPCGSGRKFKKCCGKQ
jgi:uncharacterized protein